MRALRRYFFSLSLRTQLLFMALLLALPSIILIIYLGFDQRNDYLNEGIAESNRLANEIASEQYNQTGNAEQLLTVLAQIPAIREKNATATNALLSDILKRNQQFGNIIVTDRNGDAWASALPMTKAISVNNVRTFKNAMDSKHFSSGEYTIGRISAKRTIGFGYPILDAQGNVENVIFVNFNFDKINELFAKSGMPSGTSFTLIDHKGTIIDRNLEPDSLIGTQDKDELFQRMKSGPKEDSFIGVGLRGTKQIISTHKMTLSTEAFPYLYIRVAVPLEETLLKAQTNQIKYMVLLFPFLIGVIMLVLVIGKRCFVVPISKLHEASQHLANGDLDLRVSEYVEGGELGRLGQAFDGMAIQLAEREQALRKSESNYKFLAENSADIIWCLDSNRCITYINPADERLRGYSKEDVLGKRLIDLMPPNDAEHLTKINSERYLQEQAGIVTGLTIFEASMYCKNGEVICVEVLSSPIRDDNGSIIGSHGVARDISRRKKADEERETASKRPC